ncbi:MAG: restriction endonuclease [Arthrospira sp. PLM2.Bin9]|nr:hypothetical protein [Arthrospira sp. PLM2.Bin9]TVU52735.1 MAG: restriction endonuclease [Arthrospira sp. PLM2.Bin9]
MNEKSLQNILEQYQNSFIDKVYSEENDQHDPLMDVFSLSPELKRENRQYWGRELGMCWQLLVMEVCRIYSPNFKPPLKLGNDQPCDLIVGPFAIDTKYRIGSGDSGTLKKLKSYGRLLQEHSYNPTLLILRNDNLPAAINACKTGSWQVYTGDDSFKFLHDLSGFDLKYFLTERAGAYPVDR